MSGRWYHVLGHLPTWIATKTGLGPGWSPLAHQQSRFSGWFCSIRNHLWKEFFFSTPIPEISKVTTLQCLLFPKWSPKSRSNCWTLRWSFCQILGRASWKFCQIRSSQGWSKNYWNHQGFHDMFFSNSESSRLLFHLAMLHQRSPWT